MKKILVFCFAFLLAVPSFADLFDLGGFTTKTKAQADQEFERLGDLLSQTLNSGLGDAMNIGFVKGGVEMVVVPFKKEGVLSNAPVSVLPMPYLYGGVSLFGITPFARVMPLVFLKQNGKTPMFIGGGLGYEIDFTPLFTLMPSATYHTILNFDDLKVSSMAFHLQARVNLLLVTAFANAGYSINKYKTEINLLDATKFEYSKNMLHASIGAKVLFLYAELGILPSVSYTVGVSIGF
ncbi:MAG TPA: hypothetical protein DHW82_02520 [Spirochaetia bacterium]|nr:MAG: hypothetical protein A2Y41_01555 [Spirochaetes bacterium GWB1_36_13]HCL55865.1 hypothetical protein [Spirochaetia bacterium]